MAAKSPTTEGMMFRWSDAVITCAASLASAYMFIRARWVPGWDRSAIAFALIAAGPPLFRWLSWKFPSQRLYDFLASIWIMPAVITGHLHLGPLVDALNPTLADAWLAMADLHLFGFHPAIELSRVVPRPLMDLLMVCYYCYFALPFALGMWLYFRERRAVFEEFSLALSLLYTLNYTLYIVVPAIGPRFFLAPLLPGPLQGSFLTPFLDSLMRVAMFNRDCFPSGHTAVTLVVFIYAFRFVRPSLRIFLPIGSGLIIATIAGRFHYGIDILCAIPMAAACTSAASYLLHRAEALPVSRFSLPVRQPAKI